MFKTLKMHFHRKYQNMADLIIAVMYIINVWIRVYEEIYKVTVLV